MLRLVLMTTAMMSIVGLAYGQSRLDHPVMYGGDANYDACGSSGVIVGLDPRGDGFLSVQSGSGGRPFREIDRLYNGSQVTLCDNRGKWTGVVYGREGQDCGTGSPIRARRPYLGPCRVGWVFSRYVRVTAG